VHPHYEHYKPLSIERLDALYGAVDARANERLRTLVFGTDVLDLGCGFGSLVDHLRVHGLHAIGVDLLEHQVAEGLKRFPAADLRVVSADRLPFPDSSFDTVILKESLHHLAAEGSIEDSMGEVARVCRRRVIVYEPNPMFLLKLSRTLLDHVDPTCPPAMARDFLKLGGFKVKSLTYSDALVFPLSGGYVARPLAPRVIAATLFPIDNALVRTFKGALSWRYTMVADK
jgi:ubiquinone/menaquinone biosynthesis C-methylase UbiE